MQADKGHIVVDDGVRLFFESAGNAGNPLVILNGFCLFQDFKYLAENRPVIARLLDVAKDLAAGLVSRESREVIVTRPAGNLAPLDCAIGRGVAAIRAVDEIMPKYLLYALRATESALASKSTGTTFDAVPGSVVRGHLIRLAPTAEQRRIVAAIEEQFSRIDAGVEALQRARRNLQRMRAAVLRQAFERGLGDDELGDEPAEILLREILEERRRAWESGRGSGKYREPAPPSLRRTRRKIPDGWVWASLEQLTDGARKIAYGVLQPGRHVENGVPFVRVGDVTQHQPFEALLDDAALGGRGAAYASRLDWPKRYCTSGVRRWKRGASNCGHSDHCPRGGTVHLIVPERARGSC